MNIVKWLSNIAGSFQPAYDKVKALKFPPEVDKLIDSMWAGLGKDLQDSIWNFLKVVVEKYGEEAAKELLRRILEGIKAKGYIITS